MPIFGLSTATSDADVIKDTVIDVAAVKERYRHVKAIRHGYTGLALFLVFMCLYVYVLGKQHRLDIVGEANLSFQIFFDKMKADVATIDVPSFYSVMTKKVVPGLHGASWNQNGTKLGGRVTNEFYYLLGGLIITAVKGPVDNCFRDNPCYSQESVVKDFYPIRLPGGAGEFKVPYNHDFGGYSVGLPGSLSQEATTTLLGAYSGLFEAPDTREIWVHAVVFNPSGYKAVTSLAFGGSISIHNNIDFHTKITSVPYHFYNPGLRMVPQILAEVGLLCFAANFFIRPLYQYRFGEPKIDVSDLNDTDDPNEYLNVRTKWLDWCYSWRHLPCKGGIILWKIPIALYSLLFASALFWMSLGTQYSKLGWFGGDDFTGLFVDPLADAGTALHSQMTACSTAMNGSVLPLNLLVDEICRYFNMYFFMHVGVMTLMVMRLNEYLMFQKRLSMVADTFSGVFDDLLHMGLVLIIICFMFGVLCSLAFGAYDQPFQDNFQAFYAMILVCFGLFKPAASTPFVQSLFKYSPHLVTANEFLSWVPLCLTIMFKTVVVLLLFKLLMGVIMESYKKHAKLKDGAATVRADLYELSLSVYHYVAHTVLGRPYVSLFHVAFALAHLPENYVWKAEGIKKLAADKNLAATSIAEGQEVTEAQKDMLKAEFKGGLEGALKDGMISEARPWARHFLGLESPESIKNALNAVLEHDEGGAASEGLDRKLTIENSASVRGASDIEKSQRVQALVKHHGCQPCEDRELAFALRAYGTNREKAEAMFKKLWFDSELKHIQRKEAKELEAKEAKKEAKTEAFRKVEETMQNLLRQQEQLDCDNKVGNKKNIQDDMTEEQIQDVFDEYDFLNIGTVDHRLMPQLFKQLGYRIPAADLGRLLAHYDHNEDGDTSFKEFEAMLQDNRLIGLYGGLEASKVQKLQRSSQRWKKVRMGNKIGSMLGKLKKVAPASSAETPLLQAQRSEPAVSFAVPPDGDDGA